LPEPYFAASGRRVWVEVSDRYIEPDVNVLHRGGRGQQNAGGTAVAAAPRMEPVVIKVPHDERRQAFIEIRVRNDAGEKIVTLIEILSPSNKRSGDHARELYQTKQKEVLESQVHLVEIDLLRGGEHTTAVPLDRLQEETPPHAYHVCIHRFDKFEDYIVYPIPLNQRLPEIRIPLLPGDADVVVDLQTVFDRAYDTGPYRRQIRYGLEVPPPPLPADQLEWVRSQVRNPLQ
jgi:hypothetical protein